MWALESGGGSHVGESGLGVSLGRHRLWVLRVTLLLHSRKGGQTSD